MSKYNIKLMVGAFFAVAGLLIFPVAASAQPNVEGTYTVNQLGQGGWTISGPAYADGTVGGGGLYTGYVNGEISDFIKARVVGGTWWEGANEMVHFCWDAEVIGNPSQTFTYCLEVPENGTPVTVTNPDGSQTLVRANFHWVD